MSMRAFLLAILLFAFKPLYAVTHTTAVRTSVCDFIVDKLDVGAASPSNAILNFNTSGDVLVAHLVMSLPAYGNASSGTATANSITADANAVGGTVAKFTQTDSSGNIIIQGSVTATGGGGDITLNSVTISAAQQVSMTSLTYSSMP